MGAWPDWWPANPIGEAWDRNQAAWTLVAYGLCGLVGLLIILYIWGKLRD